MSDNTYNALIRDTEARRVISMAGTSDWFVHEFNHLRYRSPVILPWIRDHSTGRFYLDSGAVGFENEKDYFMFKLGYPYFD